MKAFVNLINRGIGRELAWRIIQDLEEDPGPLSADLYRCFTLQAKAGMSQSCAELFIQQYYTDRKGN
jgi:hypothetical protein